MVIRDFRDFKIISILLCIGVFFLASQAHADSDEVKKCIERGVAYFKEIGSFPTLSDGRSALKVAQERCQRTTTAF